MVYFAIILSLFFCSKRYAVNGFIFRGTAGISKVNPTPLHIRQPSHQKISGASSSSSPDAPSVVDNDDMPRVSVPIAYNSTVAYAAANEYIRAHYNQSEYFATNNKVEHEFYDGRILQSQQYENNEREMLNDNGLAILSSTVISSPNEINWSDVNDIQHSYLPQLEKILHQLFPTNLIIESCFWNPMLRGEDIQISRANENDSADHNTPTANIASLVHIDTDVGAYEIDELLAIIEKNKVSSQSTSASRTNVSWEEVSNAITKEKKRFAIINFWRNIGDEPVSSAPLAILSTQYDKDDDVFPNVQPNMKKSKWYVFPNATKDEVIVFYQYDRNILQPSDLWHCAITTSQSSSSIGKDDDKSIQAPRKSFDVRAFVLLDESVADGYDRFSVDRTRPILTFEESGCFCDEQAAKRRK